MAGRQRRLALALVAAVALGHLATLEWLARRIEPPGALQRLADPLFTRMLVPQATPPPPVVLEAKRPARRARTARSAMETIAAAPPAEVSPAVPELPPAVPELPAAVPEPPPPTVAEGTATPELTPQASAASPSPTQAQAGPLDSWPSSTRLSYQLTGQFRSGPLFGNAQVRWLRDGEAYQVRVNIDVTPWTTLQMLSEGRVTADALMPRAYEEVRGSGRRRAAQIGETTVSFEGDRSAPRPDGVQDTASQFVDLAHRFATGREALEVGRDVKFWLARPGGVDLWTYDVIARETLQLPQIGTVEAFRLVPRPLDKPRGNITAEMWFAPSLQYLPVRIRVSMGAEAQLDLLAEKIEQQ